MRRHWYDGINFDYELPAKVRSGQGQGAGASGAECKLLVNCGLADWGYRRRGGVHER